MSDWLELLEVEHLPEALRDIAGVIGINATVKLSERFGGGAVSIPKAKTAQSKLIEDTIGLKASTKLVQHFGGGSIYLPQIDTAMAKIKAQYIKSNRKSMTIQELRMATGYSDKQILRIYDKIDFDNNQLGIFFNPK